MGLPLLRAVHLSNYRSVGDDASLVFPAPGDDAARLITLAGRNNAGKSNVLDALRFVRDVLRDGPIAAARRRGGLSTLLRDGATAPLRIVLEHDHPEGRLVWGMTLRQDTPAPEPTWADWGGLVKTKEVSAWAQRLEALHAEALQADSPLSRAELMYQGLNVTASAGLSHGFFSGKTVDLLLRAPTQRSQSLGVLWWAGEDPVWAGLCETLLGMRLYHLFPPALRGAQLASDDAMMEDDGSNWSTTLAKLSPSARMLLRVALSRVAPDLEDVRVVEAGDQRVVQFETRTGGDARWVDAARVSDGTLRMAALLTALLQDPGPTLLGIEEPELAVHVQVLPMLAEFCVSASRRMPVVLTTHSPDFLDHVPVESLRVVRHEDEGTGVYPLAQGQQRALQKGLGTAGDLLREEGLQAESADG